ncbi:SIMPL domain-containing protein [Kribbella sp. NPDC003557]|uniref:SIMPL domain-containing protein n=1 Tax=Kribbella sp. NPDC003557 TaxID=3154449 RepID=UPI0033A810EB
MSVVGSGQVSGTPDVLRVTFGVEQVAADVAAAVATVGERTEAVLGALRAQGVQDSQLGTSAVNVFQEYREPGTDPAYRASHTVLVETKDLTGFGALLNAAVGAIGNSLALHGLQFDIEDKSALLAQARELAFQQAKAKAGHLAALSGFSLGSVTAISESQGQFPIRTESAMLGKGAYDSALNVVPGDHTVEVSLQVHFAWA